MKKMVSIVTLSLIVFGSNAFADTKKGEELFKAKCSACHITTRPADRNKLIAPPAMGITMHVKMKYPNENDFQNFVVDYVLNPSAAKALCMPQTVKRFGVMPSQKGNVSEDELKDIADYLYKTFAKGGNLQKRHQMMMQRMHQGGGMGQGHGGGMGRGGM